MAKDVKFIRYEKFFKLLHGLSFLIKYVILKSILSLKNFTNEIKFLEILFNIKYYNKIDI